MLDAADARLSELAKQLDQRDALEDRLCELLDRGSEAQDKLHAVKGRLGRIDKEVLRLEETGLRTLLSDRVSDRRVSDLSVKRELREGATAEFAECEAAVESLRKQADNIQREVGDFEQIEAEYKALAEQKLELLNESDSDVAKRITDLHAEVDLAHGNQDMITRAMDDCAEAQRVLSTFTSTLIGTGKAPPKVRSRGMTGFMLGGPILGVVLAAFAVRKNSSVKRKIAGPLQEVNAALDQLGDTLATVHWNSRLAADSAIHDIMSELLTTQLDMGSDFEKSAAGKPASAVELAGLVDGLMRQLCKKKEQEWSQLRRVNREWRSLLAGNSPSLTAKNCLQLSD